MKVQISRWYGFYGIVIIGAIIFIILKLLSDERRVEVVAPSAQESSEEKYCEADTLRINQAFVYDLRRVGFSYYEICRILELRLKGSTIESVEDLRKIKYIDTVHLSQIEPYLIYDIRPEERAHAVEKNRYPTKTKSNSYAKSNYEKRGTYPKQDTARTVYTPKVKPVIPIIELNEATIDDLVKLPYIKEGRAKQILDYRDKLGGFVSTDQILEIKFMTEEQMSHFVDYMTVDPTTIRKIDISTTNPNTLKKHPYLTWPIIETIYAYRVRNKNKPLSESTLRQILSAHEVNPNLWLYLEYSAE